MSEYVIEITPKLSTFLNDNPDLLECIRGEIVRCRECRFRVDDVDYDAHFDNPELHAMARRARNEIDQYWRSRIAEVRD